MSLWHPQMPKMQKVRPIAIQNLSGMMTIQDGTQVPVAYHQLGGDELESVAQVKRYQPRYGRLRVVAQDQYHQQEHG